MIRKTISNDKKAYSFLRYIRSTWKKIPAVKKLYVAMAASAILFGSATFYADKKLSSNESSKGEKAVKTLLGVLVGTALPIAVKEYRDFKR